MNNLEAVSPHLGVFWTEASFISGLSDDGGSFLAENNRLWSSSRVSMFDSTTRAVRILYQH